MHESDALDRPIFEPLMTVSEIALLARQSDRTIARRVADGTIPSKRLGRSIRITRKAALDYLGIEATGLMVDEPIAAGQAIDEEEPVEMHGYRVRVHEVVEYDVMLRAESADDAKAIVETEDRELDGGTRIEDGTPHVTVSLHAISVEPYPDLDE
jgi:excisionase family DNA binding protein